MTCAARAVLSPSARGQASDQARTRAAGFDAHVVKPVDLPQLTTMLDRMLSHPELKIED
jgi:CheY-like chemotaxis protein